MKPMSCWKEKGTDGDRSCAELEAVKHCRNCGTFLDAGRRLFDRPLPPEYLREQTQHLMREKEASAAYSAALVVFRIAQEWFGLSTGAVQEVLPWAAAHAVPHRTNAVFQGLINANGELLPCCLGQALLALTAGEEDGLHQRRLLILSAAGKRYALAVDELSVVVRIDDKSLKPAPATVLRSPAALTKSVLEHDGRHIGVLDTDRVFDALGRSLGGS